MNAWRIARAGVRALTLLVAAVSGGYLIIYLYRWEWNRALISGLFFLAALVTFSTSLVLGALRGIAERLDRLEGAIGANPDAARATGRAIRRASAAGATTRFDWLREPPDRFGVFVPVLLGTGVLLSGVAYLVERLAGLFAGATVDRKSARLLSPDLPLGTAPRAAAAPQPARASTPPRAARLLGWGVALAVGVLAVTAGVNLIAEATQSHDEPVDGSSTTAIDLLIEQRTDIRAAETVALALWTACEGTLGHEAHLLDTEPLDVKRVRLTVDQGLGDLARRRLFGCLEDATLDLVWASVTDFDVRPD